MHFQLISSIAALVSLTSAESLSSVLAGHGSFSLLHSLLKQFDLLDAFDSSRNVTVLAPTDHAIIGLANWGINLSVSDPDIARAIFNYGLLDGVHTSRSVADHPGVPVVHSALRRPQPFTNVSDGAAVKLHYGRENSDFVIESGIQVLTPVQERDIIFDHGVIHAIDSTLVLPHNVSATLEEGHLIAFLHLLDRSGLVSEIERLADVTLFIPHNGALEKLLPLLDVLPAARIRALVGNHLVPNSVLFGEAFKDGETVHRTLSGGELRLKRTTRGTLYVNDVKVVRDDLVIYGGVAHLIDGLLVGPSDSEREACETTTNFIPTAFMHLPSAPGSLRNILLFALVSVVGVVLSFKLYTRRSTRRSSTPWQPFVRDIKRMGLGI